MFEGESLVAHSLPQLVPTGGMLQCANDKSPQYQPQSFLSMEDCFITDLEEFLRSTDIPKEAEPVENSCKTTPTPSPTTMEVPDYFYGHNSPVQIPEEYNMASPRGVREVVKDDVPINSPPSLYHDRGMNALQKEEAVAKRPAKYGHLVSLLSAPPMPMTNTINENIVSQLGHANPDNVPRGVTSGSASSEHQGGIKKEVIDPGFLVEIKRERRDESFSRQEPLEQQMAADECHLPCDIGSLAMEHVYRDIQATCNALGIAADPTKWTSGDVKCWLMKTIQELKLPQISLNYFQMDGLTLCAMNEMEFCERAPQCGETLYAQLYIWKTAANYRPTAGLNRFASSEQHSVATFDGFVPWHTNFNSPGSPDSIGSIENVTYTSDVRKVSSVDNCSTSAPSCSSIFHNEMTHTDDEITSEDGECVEMPSTPAETPSPSGPKSGSSHSHIHLWQFLKELLSQPHMYGSCIRWIDRTKGIFKIEDSVRVARLWGKRKNRPAMNYDKLSRSIRQYYKKGIMKKTERSQRLVYQFCTPYCL